MREVDSAALRATTADPVAHAKSAFRTGFTRIVGPPRPSPHELGDGCRDEESRQIDDVANQQFDESEERVEKCAVGASDHRADE